MPSHGSVAASVRARKSKHPSDFCADRRCLWRVKHPGSGKPDTPCPKHPVRPAPAPVTELLLRPVSGEWSPVQEGETMTDRKARDLGGYPEL